MALWGKGRGAGVACTTAAAAAALHVPVIDGGGDVPVAEGSCSQRVLITAGEGDIAPWRHLLCGQRQQGNHLSMSEGRCLQEGPSQPELVTWDAHATGEEALS